MSQFIKLINLQKIKKLKNTPYTNWGTNVLVNTNDVFFVSISNKTKRVSSAAVNQPVNKSRRSTEFPISHIHFTMRALMRGLRPGIVLSFLRPFLNKAKPMTHIATTNPQTPWDTRITITCCTRDTASRQRPRTQRPNLHHKTTDTSVYLAESFLHFYTHFKKQSTQSSPGYSLSVGVSNICGRILRSCAQCVVTGGGWNWCHTRHTLLL